MPETSTQKRCSSLTRSATNRAGPRSLPTLAGSACCAASTTKPESARRRPFQSLPPPTTNGSGLVDSGSWASSPHVRGAYHEAHQLLDRSLELARQLAAPAEIAGVLCSQACLALDQTSFDEAARLVGELLALKPLPHTMRRATYGWVLGEVARANGDMEQAQAHYQRDLIEAESSSSPRLEALARKGLADVAIAESDLSRAVALNTRSLALRAQMEDSLGIANSLEGMAAMAIAADGPQRAARMLGAAQGLRARLGAASSPREERELNHLRTAITDKLGTELAERELSAGQQLTVSEAIDLALGES